MEENQYSSDNISEYNESALKTMRLAECWNRCNVQKSVGNLIGWKVELDIAADEILPDAELLLSIADYKLFAGKLSKIHKKIIEAEKEKSKAKRTFWLRQRERTLRLINNKIGRGVKIKYLEDAGRAIAMD